MYFERNLQSQILELQSIVFGIQYNFIEVFTMWKIAEFYLA